MTHAAAMTQREAIMHTVANMHAAAITHVVTIAMQQSHMHQLRPAANHACSSKYPHAACDAGNTDQC